MTPELIKPTSQSANLTSIPFNGWVAVESANLEKADGYVILDVAIPDFQFEGGYPKTIQKKIGEKTWHFSLVNIDGCESIITTAKTGQVIAEYATLVTGLKVSEVHFHERTCDKFMLCSSYVPEQTT